MIKSDTLNKYKFLYSPTIFIIVLGICHYLWKFSFTEGTALNGKDVVYLWNEFNVTDFFNFFVSLLISPVIWLLENIFNLSLHQNNNLIYLTDIRSSVAIVWSCSGLKQMFIFCMIILFSCGSFKNKLWFIPVSLLLIYLVNVLRISLIIYLFNKFSDSFDLLHESSKYIFYIILFFMWVVWDKKFGLANE